MKKIGILVLMLILGVELVLRVSQDSRRFPKSWSRIWGLYEKSRHVHGDLGHRLGRIGFYLVPERMWHKEIKDEPLGDIEDRVNYYCQLQGPTKILHDVFSLDELKRVHGRGGYYFDLWETIRYFPNSCKLVYLPGDITYVPEEPTIVKSRPIAGENTNSVLMKMDKGRHFVFVKDKRAFHEKETKLVWRGQGCYPHRARFIRQFKDHPLCDIADTSRPVTVPEEHKNGKGYMSTEEQLAFKFILSLEGADVATNLKWIMSSNSLCFAPKQKYETWFMEGRLIPNYHYVLIKDDYSDLIEKIDYYAEHEGEALAIIENAHKYIEQFQDEKREARISLEVMKRYFALTNEI